MEHENVTMTPEEKREFEAFKADKEKKATEAKRKADREAYKDLIDENVRDIFPAVIEISETLSKQKSKIYDSFTDALKLKAQVYGTNDGQRSHTFTSKDGTKRIVLGNYETDGYDDTVNDGIAKVQEYIKSLAKDDESKLLVSAILKLLSRDQKGNLKASRVMQLRKMADDSRNEEFIDGVRIIEAAYRPVISKQFVKAEQKNDKNQWVNIPLGMTEA